LISKTHKNCKNKISKRRKIYGGGKVFDWNLGPIILKKEKGLLSDTYWMEYPTDPIENGWTQIIPQYNAPTPKYKCNTKIKPPKEDYSWDRQDNINFDPLDDYNQVHNSMILNEQINQRPLPDGSFVSNCKDDTKMCLFDYLKHNNKLSEQKWKKTDEIPNTRITGKKEFIRNFHTINKKHNPMVKLPTWEEQNIKKPVVGLYYLFKKLLLSYDIKSIPSEFIDLYNDVKNDTWRLDFVQEMVKKK